MCFSSWLVSVNRVQGLVAAFPKLVGTGDKQHTYVETEAVRCVGERAVCGSCRTREQRRRAHVTLCLAVPALFFCVCRYVYQPLEQLYLLLITNKGSNIMEDLDTLHLLSKVVPDQCHGPVTEDRIAERAFELLFAFDEAITSGGHKEGVTLQQIRTNLVRCVGVCGYVTPAV